MVGYLYLYLLSKFRTTFFDIPSFLSKGELKFSSFSKCESCHFVKESILLVVKFVKACNWVIYARICKGAYLFSYLQYLLFLIFNHACTWNFLNWYWCQGLQSSTMFVVLMQLPHLTILM